MVVNYDDGRCSFSQGCSKEFYDCDADNSLDDTDGADNLDSTVCGWRYLEAAPEGWYGFSDPAYGFGYFRGSDLSNIIIGTQLELGDGKGNTEGLVDAMGSAAYIDFSADDTTAQYAAKVCDDYSLTVGGIVYDNWFLPSSDELNQMREKLFNTGQGGFSARQYWSSSECGETGAWCQNFLSGKENTYSWFFEYRVRPVRAF